MQLQQQQQKTKNKEHTQDEIDLEIQEHINKVEQENFDIVVHQREKLKEAHKKQKQTTQDLLKQGEQLGNISKTAGRIYKKSKEGEKTTEDIKREGRFFKFPKIFTKIKEIFKPKDKVLENINKKKEKKSEYKPSELDSKTGATTDDNLKLLLGDLRQMRKEAEFQNKEINKQKVDINHISKVSKESEHIMSKTTQELRKI